MPKRSLLFGTLIGLFLVAIIFVVMEQQYGQRVTLPEGRTDTSAEVLIGGPFTLTAPDSTRVSESDFSGRFMLIYFGYTFCPDVCPLDLQKITMALDQLEQQGVDLSPLQPLFVTIDPARDTPEVMGQYVSYFHPSLIGLTGSEEDIAAAAKTYRVYYARAGADNTAENKRENSPANIANIDEQTYMMDHSSYIYLMGPDGKYRDHFSSTDSPETIAEDLQRHLKGE